MSKILDFFKKIPAAYYNWKKRNENLEKFLESSQKNEERIGNIDRNVSALSESVNSLKEQIKDTREEIGQINGRLEIIGRGTKMELFDTLHSWRMTLVAKKWASVQEKKEVETIWKIYHEGLKGNGQGEHYYNEIMDLPETPEEVKDV